MDCTPKSGDYSLESITLTCRPFGLPDEEGVELLNRFRQRLSAAKLPCVWRVEVHKSGWPHVHLVTWSVDDAEESIAIWRDLCGDDCGERGIMHVSKCGVGWLAYVALHNSKLQQGLWRGRSWGVINKSAFHEMEPLAVLEFESLKHEDIFRRLLTRVLWVRGVSTRIQGYFPLYWLGIDEMTVLACYDRSLKMLGFPF